MPNNSVSANGGAVPKNKIWSVCLDINRHNLQRLTMSELAVVMDTVVAARDAINGIQNQPRCRGAAHDELDAMQDGFNDAIEMIVDIAECAKPVTAEEAEERAFLILHHETWGKDTMDRMMAIVARLYADVKHVESMERGEAV